MAAILLTTLAGASHGLVSVTPAGAGLCAGAGSAGWSAWLLWPWRSMEFKTAMKRMAAGFFLRLVLVAAIAFWGFATQMAAGLAGILAFGLTFLALTWIEHSRIFAR